MINNFNEIRQLLKFDNEDMFYFIQILSRRKDNPNQIKDVLNYGNHCIYSHSQFDELEPIILNLCDALNARAYIHVNPRSAKEVAKKVLERLVKYINTDVYKPVERIFISCTGQDHTCTDRKWIIDIDWKLANGTIIDDIDKSRYVDSIASDITLLLDQAKRETKLLYFPTKNGLHIVCSPFRLDKFKEKYPDIDVHKDNMLVLCCK